MQQPILKIFIQSQKEQEVEIKMEYMLLDKVLDCSVVANHDFTQKDQEHLRWYLEDYTYQPFEPNPEIAKQIEGRLQAIGEQFFISMFYNDEESIILCRNFLENIVQTKVDVVNNSRQELPFPLELIKSPDLNDPIFLKVESISYIVQGNTTSQTNIEAGLVRVLLVISRPSQYKDVPFHSVGRMLTDALRSSGSRHIILEVLRPPTFQKLEEKLSAAVERNQPYTMLHFDGHGIFEDINAVMVGETPQKYRGYILFENNNFPGNVEYIQGKALGEMLVRNGVYFVVLNACQSAKSVVINRKTVSGSSSYGYPSFATELIKAGVTGCLAMRYNVFVNTAADFMFNFYSSFSENFSLRSAAADARKQLHKNTFLIQDWIVPVTYEQEHTPVIKAGNSLPTADSLDQSNEFGFDEMPYAGDTIFGIDHLFLHLENIFNNHNSVLVEGWAIGGKTTAIKAFASWYKFTHGVEQTVYCSFCGLQDFDAFIGRLENILLLHTIPDPQAYEKDRIRKILLTLSSVQSLLVLDDIHAVLGNCFKSAYTWSEKDIWRTKQFLQQLQSEVIKFIIVSSGWGEKTWDTDEKTFVNFLTIEEAAAYGNMLLNREHVKVNPSAWKTLIEFPQGNPLLVKVCMDLVVKNKLVNYQEFEATTLRLRRGLYENMAEQVLSQLLKDRSQFQTMLLQKFNSVQLDKISCTQPFQTWLSLTDLGLMADSKMSFYFPMLTGFDEHADLEIFKAFADIGLMTSLSKGLFATHPMLPFFLRGLYEERVVAKFGSDLERSFAGDFADMGGYLYDQFLEGNLQGFALLQQNRFNLWFALDLALEHKLFVAARDIFLALVEYYERNGRAYDILRFVTKMEPFYFDLKTGYPLNEDDGCWHFIMEAKTRITMDFGNAALSEKLLGIKMEIQQKKAGALLDKDEGTLTSQERIVLNNYQVTVGELASLLAKHDVKKAIEHFNTGMKIAEKLGDKASTTIYALNLSGCYLQLGVKEANPAYEYAQIAFENCPAENNEQKGGALVALSQARLYQSYDLSLTDEQYAAYLQEAYSYCSDAIDELPANAAMKLLQTYQTRGSILNRAGHPAKAMESLNHALSFANKHGFFDAGITTRHEMIDAMIKLKEYDKAVAYAEYIVNNGDASTHAQSIAYANKIISQYKSNVQ
ncbi:CHAT domain-containing protein [Taibaiella soli]|uniref:CHAT domain-containing protein n=1 Tax=Taibaiella soli TaxID=1649169 RepID=A0A2W2BXI5_9BACT|nr:CHAT domain-containing protein [Taibaiella soli]PZF72573.1 hypothetical protein DN068_11960 [Taibaiella soli]